MTETRRDSLRANEVADLDPYNVRIKQPQVSAGELLPDQDGTETTEVSSLSFEEVLPRINFVAGKLEDRVTLRDLFYYDELRKDANTPLEYKNLMGSLAVNHKIVLTGAIGRLNRVYKGVDGINLGEVRSYTEMELVNQAGVSQRTAYVIFNTFKKN